LARALKQAVVLSVDAPQAVKSSPAWSAAAMILKPLL